MSKFPVGLLTIVYCLLPGSAFAQQVGSPPLRSFRSRTGASSGLSDLVVRCSASRKAGDRSGEVAAGNDDRTTDGRCHVERRIAAARGSR